MTTPITVNAVYEGGVLRPAQPLPLAEGETVEVTVTPVKPIPSPAEEEVIRRMKAAQTLQEFFEIANSIPPPDDGYDLLKALDANRRLAGERPLFPPDEPGGAQ